MPRRYTLRVFNHLVIPLFILVDAALIVTLPFAYPSTGPVVWCWLILFGGYFLLRYWLKWPRWLFARETFLLRVALGVMAIWVFQVLVQYAGYEHGGRDPHSLWILYLVPLAAVSLFGTSRQWLRTLGVASGLLLGLRLADILTNDAGGLSGPARELPIVLSAAILTLGQVAALALLALAIHVLVRRMREREGFLIAGRDMTGHLATRASFLAAYQEAAQAVQKLHSPPIPYVFLLLWDEHTQRLKLVGAVGKPSDVWGNIELRKGEGISGHVMENGEPLNVEDVTDPKWARLYYLAPGFEDVQSELAVPVIYQNRVIGVLDVESPAKRAFDEDDRFILEGWANSLAVSFGHFLLMDENVARVYRLAKETIEASKEHTRLSEWFSQVASPICECLNANGLALLRLAPGTGYPLLPFAIWPKKLGSVERRLRVPDRIPQDSILWRLLDDWEMRYWTREDNWGVWDTQVDGWLLKELQDAGAAAMTFVPVGSIEKPLAALFVLYGTPVLAGDTQKLALLTLAVAMEKSYQTLMPPPVEPQRLAATVHQVLVPSTQRLFAEVAAIRSDGENPVSMTAHLTNIEQGIRELRERVKHATVSERFDLSDMTLGDAIRLTANEFEELRPEELRVFLELDSCVEDEPLYTRRVLYWVVVEAISNAVEHGRASYVEVRIQHDRQAITVEVRDDGIGMQIKSPPIKSHGIFHLGRILRRTMAARLEICTNIPQGTRVVLRLPIRPRR